MRKAFEDSVRMRCASRALRLSATRVSMYVKEPATVQNILFGRRQLSVSAAEEAGETRHFDGFQRQPRMRLDLPHWQPTKITSSLQHWKPPTSNQSLPQWDGAGLPVAQATCLPPAFYTSPEAAA